MRCLRLFQCGCRGFRDFAVGSRLIDCFPRIQILAFNRSCFFLKAGNFLLKILNIVVLQARPRPHWLIKNPSIIARL